MGMYTECRGWIKLKYNSLDDKKFKALMKRMTNLSPRADQCISSTIYHLGFDLSSYIFIGGNIKNYDNDWDIFIKHLLSNVNFADYHIETRYEECEEWTVLKFKEVSS